MIALLAVLPFLFATASAEPASDWLVNVPASLRTDPNGKKLTQAQVDQLAKNEVLIALIETDGNPIKKGIAMAVIDAPPKKVFATLGDYENFKDFMPYVAKTVVDKREGKQTWVSYWLEFPMNIGNRNYQLELTDGSRDVDGLPIFASDWKWTGIGNILGTTGAWEVAPWGDGTKSLARYTVLTDPGGSFPTWIKNKAAGTALPKVIKAVRGRVASAKAKPAPAE